MESQFGKFKLIQRIGGGRLSQVFRVRSILDQPGDPRVALKRVHPEAIGEPAFVRLVVREAGVLTRLTHPALCRCLELGVVDGSAFLTLELVDGCTLRALMRRLAQLGATLPQSAVIALGRGLAEVLDYLHRGCSHPLIHLDLSPQNVMIARDGGLKLIDFGLAQYLDGHNPPPIGDKIAGTVGYMSPEQARGDAVTRAGDQYGLGVLLWEMLAGRRLFRGNTGATWERMRVGDVPPAAEAMPRVSPPLAELLYTMLAPRPERRFAHLGVVVEAFDRVSPSRARGGRRSLAALVDRLMDDPTFDPFDVVRPKSRKEAADLPADIPSGEEGPAAEEYAELSIEVDHGAGSPASQVRAVLPNRLAPSAAPPPDSPFLETIPEATATATARSQ